MDKLWMIVVIGLILILLTLVAFAIIKKKALDKLNYVFAANTVIILSILVIGFVDGRLDMYIDIALSYAILGFVTSVVIAKYIGGKK